MLYVESKNGRTYKTRESNKRWLPGAGNMGDVDQKV